MIHSYLMMSGKHKEGRLILWFLWWFYDLVRMNQLLMRLWSQ